MASAAVDRYAVSRMRREWTVRRLLHASSGCMPVVAVPEVNLVMPAQ